MTDEPMSHLQRETIQSRQEEAILDAALKWYLADQDQVDEACANLSAMIYARYKDKIDPFVGGIVEKEIANVQSVASFVPQDVPAPEGARRIYRFEDIQRDDVVQYQDFGVAVQDNTEPVQFTVVSIGDGWLYSMSDIRNPIVNLRAHRWGTKDATTARVWHLIDRPSERDKAERTEDISPTIGTGDAQ